MENNIYENGLTPEAEVPQQAVEQPVEQPAVEPVEQPVENKNAFNDVVNSSVAKAKELVANAAPLLEKVKALPKKIWIMAGAGVVALIAIIVVLSLLGNTYKTPIAAAEKLLNMKSVEKIINNAPSVLNGFGESEAKKLIKIVKKSDQYSDVIEDAEDMFEEVVENLKDEFGNNYKIKLKVTDKEKLEKDDCKEFRDQLRDISDLADNFDDLDSDDYEDMADELGISKAQAKDMVNILKSFCKKCKTAKVSAGYEVTVAISITGSEVDDPEETELDINVFKVDGRWVPDVFTIAQDSSSLIGLLGMAGAF